MPIPTRLSLSIIFLACIGRRKIAELLAAFYFSDPSAAWFRSDAGE